MASQPEDTTAAVTRQRENRRDALAWHRLRESHADFLRLLHAAHLRLGKELRLILLAPLKDRFPRTPTGCLAGSNTCYHSCPGEEGELGKLKPVVQTSNRRFRDDEFLIPRDLTEGCSAIRIRVEFTPVKIPLLPSLPVGELAWSEIRYEAYCRVMPEVEVPQ
jgi:hypothetical protein